MIVFCHLLNDRSGSPTVLRSTIEALAGRKDCILYVGSQGRGVLEETPVPVRRYWYRRSRHKIVTLFTYLVSQIALFRALSRSKDIAEDAVVFVNTLLPFGAMIWGRRSGRRVIVHVHEVSISPGVLRRFLIGCAARCADRLVYVSNDHQDRLPIEGPPADIVFNPVAPAFRQAAQDIAYAPRRSGQFQVLMLASLRGYKGIEEFMALAKDLRSRQDIRFTLVLNAEPDEVADFAARHPDADNVDLHARTDSPAAFYATADVAVNLSRVDQWIETFGLTLVEAMTFGVPVIAPPIGGPAEIVSDGQTGYCIDSRDVSSLSAAVLQLADDPRLATSMSGFARAKAAEFTFQAYADRMGQILDDVTAGQNTGART